MKRSYFIVLGLAAAAAFWLAICQQGSLTPSPWPNRRVLRLVNKLPTKHGTVVLDAYSRMFEGVSAIEVPYYPGTGPWRDTEHALAAFANSNGIHIVRFEGAGSGSPAYVCVLNKDARAMRGFVRSLGKVVVSNGALGSTQVPASSQNDSNSVNAWSALATNGAQTTGTVINASGPAVPEINGVRVDFPAFERAFAHCYLGTGKMVERVVAGLKRGNYEAAYNTLTELGQAPGLTKEQNEIAKDLREAVRALWMKTGGPTPSNDYSSPVGSGLTNRRTE